MTASVQEPASEYQRRLDRRRSEVARLERIDARLSTARGITFLVTICAALLWHASTDVSVAAPIVCFTAFLALVLAHGPLLDRLQRARRSVRHYEEGLARLADQWQGRGADGRRYAKPDHLYADDLDLFGRGSLFELLCRARTRLGEDSLAAWLSSPAAAEVIRARQRAIDELRGDLDLRESLAVLGAAVGDELDQNALARWSQQAPQLLSRAARGTAVCLSVFAVCGLAAVAVGKLGLSPLLFALILEGIFAASYGRRIRRLARTADEAGSGLAILSQVLAIIEERKDRSALLQDIRRRLETHGTLPSRQIVRLNGLIGALNNCLRNQFVAPIAFVLCLPAHLVHAIEEWRADIGPHIPDWLRAVGEFEALASLSCFAFENPDHPFPEIVEGRPAFDGRELGHPLIARSQCVRNDLRLDEETRLLIISGSNMSGKSTMLRTVGTNLVLALAGAPVRAARLSTSVLEIGSEMRIHDSLQSGQSLFYAAVSRLKSVVELAGNSRPLLFLFDEMLQGTNSHDRLIGSEGVLRALMERGALGLVTTHDLALAEISDRLGSRVANVHFEDSLVDGKMTFDYRIRPGVVRKSNALELMRLMGLDV